MNIALVPSWEVRSRAALERALARLLARLRGQTVAAEAENGDGAGPDALAHLRTVFGLTSFEQDVLLLAAGPELDIGFAAACASLGGQGAPWPSFGLALAHLPDAHWGALAPSGPLRWWRLVEPGPGPLTTAALRVDECVLHGLAGIPQLDARLMGLVTPAGAVATPSPSQAPVVDALAAAWRTGRPVAMRAPADCGAVPVAEAAARSLGLELYQMRAAEIPAPPPERAALARLWSRQAALDGSALLVLVEETDTPEAERAAADLLGRIQGAVAAVAADALPVASGTQRLELQRPARAEQAALWSMAAPAAPAALHQHLAAQFDLGPEGIAAAATASADAAGLWASCRQQSGMRLEGLAERLSPEAGWDDLILPPAQEALLREIAGQVRGRAAVLEDWGFRARLRRGLGVAALFSGPSGTGKTLAAEVLANALELDLVRIDLSAVVSKYIGETEKNLRRIFDAAETGGAVLLFDEADALFGKRTEVKDSHDRYANIEVSYLLQRMETYRGLAILTSNMKEALDLAFLRRLAFVVDFPFPDVAERERLWRRAIPEAAPTEGLDYRRLAQLSLPGGHIRNVALGAAYLAADAGAPIGMAHLLHAARRECAKLERPLTAAEMEGWA
ncbi:ATP-binding protein [Roseomonas aerophila]|uniref:ATP-binding protein n=1 Tax=Teichococcus aerophilus TaxID=1224513 RepID=A0ABR7RR92_9PROT|nr:ATP-binding protein [Pseudoroseomonas aerophila]MBC9208858.1 ATP-binding protein [Pseudoroseomonas aerophila]